MHKFFVLFNISSHADENTWNFIGNERYAQTRLLAKYRSVAHWKKYPANTPQQMAWEALMQTIVTLKNNWIF